jgi:type II secretory pathway pseudopilin PulG
MNGARDDGFILLESMIAISIITVVMSAVGAEFLSTTVAASQQRAQQVAIQMADSTVEQIRSLDASDLVTGRGSSSVTTQFGAAIPKVQLWLAKMDQASDSTTSATSGAAAAVPTIGVTQTPGTLSYTVNQYLGWCSTANATAGSMDCVPTSSLAGVGSTRYLRAVVAVTWSGQRCGTATPCSYVTSTLISASADPTFRINSAPYSASVVVAPGSQTNAVGDDVSLQMNVQDGTGVPVFTWAISNGSLPTGLSLSPAGLLSGTVLAPPGTFSATVQVTDAFLRTDTQVVSWIVKPALTYADPGPLASTTADSVNRSLTPSGGDGAPYTFTDPASSLPAGLAITTAGVISGRPTTVGTYTVNIRLGDRSGTRFYNNPFTWTVTAPPLAVSVPAAQTSTLSTAVPGLQMSASGGSGSYTWSDATPRSLPAGLAISASTGMITGTPTALGTSTATITVRDGTSSRTSTFTWNVVAQPTVTTPGNRTNSVGSAISVPLTTTCANGPCSYTFGGAAPSGLAISTEGVITGSVGTTVKTYAGITVVAKDAAGATATSGSFSWTVNAAPTMGSPGNQTTLSGRAVNLDISALDSGGTSPYTFGATGLPTWLTLNSNTGRITGTAPAGANSRSTDITVSVTDGSNVTATSPAFQWNVTNLANSIGDQTTYKSTAISKDLDTTSTGGTTPLRYTQTGLPAWLSLNSSTGVISGTSPNLATNSSTKNGPVTVTVTDGLGAVVALSPLYWFNTDLDWNVPAPFQTTKGQSMNGTDASDYLTGGASAKTYSVTNLPTGLTMSTTGAITGTTNSRGTWDVTLTVVDSVGATMPATFRWAVS